MWMEAMVAGAGSFAGGVCRFLIGKAVAGAAGTFMVNVLGCFAIGAVYAAAESHGAPWWARLFLGVGFCGGFTTFSTFANDALGMLRSGDAGGFALYAAGSVAAGLAAAWAGYAAGKACSI